MGTNPITLKQVSATLALKLSIKTVKIMPKTVSKNNKRKQESDDSLELSEDEAALVTGTRALNGAKKQGNKTTKLTTKVNSRKRKSKLESDESPDISEDEDPLKLDTIMKSSNSRPTLRRPIYSSGLEASKSGGGDCAVNAGNADYGTDVQKMLTMLGSDVNKAQQTRKRRLDQYTTGVMKASEAKVGEIIQFQVETRKQLHDEMKRNVKSVLDQWTIDMNRVKDQEEKMFKLMQQLMKMNQQTRDIQLQRMAAMRQIHDAFEKGFQEHVTKLSGQSESCLTDLSKILLELQEKMMSEGQKADMAQMQKSLKGMLFL